MSPIVYPKSHRPEEFLAASALRALLGPESLDVANRMAVRLARLEETIMGSGGWTTLQFPSAIFNRGGLWERDVAQSRITINEEGLWLFGANTKIDDSISASGFRFGRIKLNNNYPIARFGALDGFGGIRSRPCVWGAWYGFPGDFLEAEFYQNSGVDLQMIAALEDLADPTAYSPTFWAVKLTGRRTKETWTPVPTLASGDKPSASQLDDILSKDIRFLRSPPFARVTRTETTFSLGDSNWTPKIPFDTVDADTNGFFVPDSTGQDDELTINRAGLYLVGSGLDLAKNATGVRQSRITRTRGGVETIIARTGLCSGKSDVGAGTHIVCITLAKLAVGDTLELHGWHNVGSPITTRALRESAPVLWCVRLGEDIAAGALVDPRAWARDEAFTHTLWNSHVKGLLDYHYAPPACRVFRNSNQSVGRNNWAKIEFDNEDFDTDGMHSASTTAISRRVTFNDPGLYLVGGHAGFAQDATGRYLSRLYVTRPSGADAFSDAIIAENGGFNGHGTQNECVPVVTPWRAKAGDYVELAGRADGGSGTINLNPAGGDNPVDLWAIRLGS